MLDILSENLQVPYLEDRKFTQIPVLSIHSHSSVLHAHVYIYTMGLLHNNQIIVSYFITG